MEHVYSLLYMLGIQGEVLDVLEYWVLSVYGGLSWSIWVEKGVWYC